MDSRIVFTFTDFTTRGPYLGQMRGAVLAVNPALTVVDLFNDVPAYGVAPATRLLAACVPFLPSASVVIAVVDPGVGSARRPVIVNAHGHYFVGPDNGLFESLVRTDPACQVFMIEWRPSSLSRSFHGRDLFAPIAAGLASGCDPGRFGSVLDDPVRIDLPDPMNEVIYVDGYGNAVTGIAGDALSDGVRVVAGEVTIGYADTFSDVPPGSPFWYRNSLGLVEIAVNQGSARDVLGLNLGYRLETG